MTGGVVTSKAAEVIKAALSAAHDMVDSFAETMADRARDLSAVETGHNRDSVNYDWEGGKVRVFTESGYGGWLEIGTTRMSAQPYFRPAYEETKSEFNQ
jgi:HK97 gp10 family phage protein